tara:strand:- start:40 stop:753 length:714 start_codon:yes stop_codon:yes gene_type:complete
MENSKFWAAFQLSRVYNFSWIRHNNYNRSHNKHNNYNNRRNYLWAVILLCLCPSKVLANTTVASPSSNAQGTVNNNATMIAPSSTPQFRMSQGIVCSSPSLTITPYVTDAWSFNRPKEYVTRQNIYDEDTGEIKYVQETPRFEKDNYNLNYGISAQFSIPLGKAPALCHQATKVNIKNQQLLYEKGKLELALFRLKVCGEQAKLGVTFTGKYVSICDGISVTVPPGQVIPHSHSLKP